MEITPNTTIFILKNCPLDNTYEHTILFGGHPTNYSQGPKDQYNYFIGLKKHRLDKYSYQRYAKGVLAVDIEADELYDCNYLMFQNTSYNEKWFYAFITQVDYVNETTSRIHYEIDVMQTWWFDFYIGQTFIERCHTKTDNLDENIIPEGLEIGDEYVYNYYDEFDMNKMQVVAMASELPSDFVGPPRAMYNSNGVVMPLITETSGDIDVPTNLSAFQAKIEKYPDKSAIIGMFQFPLQFSAGASNKNHVTKVINRPMDMGVDVNRYVPRNKKLLTYPYCCLQVSNCQGKTATLKWENFENHTQASFNIFGNAYPLPSVGCFPTYYRGIVLDYNSGVFMNHFPNIPWVGDVYKAWWAQNKASVTASVASNAVGSAFGTIGTVASIAGAGLTGGVSLLGLIPSLGGLAGNATSLFNTAVNAVAQKQNMQAIPDTVYGQATGDSVQIGSNHFQFEFYSMSIKTEIAKVIDKFFDKFGYAVNTIDYINPLARPHWTYIKTTGATITGSVPADDLNAISRVLDNGITFWAHGDEVGQYNLDNRPV